MKEPPDFKRHQVLSTEGLDVALSAEHGAMIDEDSGFHPCDWTALKQLPPLWGCVADIPWYTCCHQFGWDLLLTCEGWLAVASTHEKHLIYPWMTVAIVYLPQERSSLFSPHVPADEPWHPKKSSIFESRRDHIYSYFAAQFQWSTEGLWFGSPQ